MFVIRYDLRTPPASTVTHAEQYRTAIEMAVFGDQNGFASVALSEHHGTEDGFMPSPLMMAGAILAATERINVGVNALLVPLHDPVRLAEDIATIDLIGPGRLSVTAGLGYRPEEFEMFGKDLHARVADFEDAIQLMLDGWKGGDVEYRGRKVRISPTPATKPHPNLIIGGSVAASAKRAARFHLPYCPALPDQALADIYYAEAKAVGFEHPLALLGKGPGLVMVTEDPDALWDEIGELLLWDAMVYEGWQSPTHKSSWRTSSKSVDQLKESPNYAIVTPAQCVELVQRNGVAVLHPLVAGIDPKIGWTSLQLVVDEVMPRLAAADA
jgi:alkanesulfonate monooxygenase SsuD/methylene tetrahydromethanopterin reductase-like flavin-dependent oxidoreductase (luciferase family)